MFGPQDPRLSPRNGPPAWQLPGPVPAVQLTPGFRAPGAQLGSLPQMWRPQAMRVPMIGLGKGRGLGPNEKETNGMLDETGTSDPMAQGAARIADAQNGGFFSWLRGLF